MGLSKDLVHKALRTVSTPGSEKDLVASGAHQSTAACDSYASIRLCVPSLDAPPAFESLARRVSDAVAREASAQGVAVTSLTIEFVSPAGNLLSTQRIADPAPSERESRANAPVGAPPQASPDPGHRPINLPGGRPTRPAQPQSEAGALPGVRHIIAVGAGKGGVGKSTVAVNLAVGLARRRHAVGLLDGDIYGPSMPTMLGLGSLDQAVLGGKLQPHYVHGVKAITIGKLVDPEKPLIWRGPMAHGAFKQLADQTDWGELDFLIIDLPPGTGDVPLTMAQMLRLTGAVVVCTPQKVAQDDAVRALRMFQQLGVEILGVVENMSWFIGDPDSDGAIREYDIFGRGGAERMAQRCNVPFLGPLPINMAMRRNSDDGNPSANFDPKIVGDTMTRHLEQLVTNLEGQVALASLRQGTTRPTLSIS